MKKLAFSGLTAVLVLGALECSTAVAYRTALPQFENVRQFMLREESSVPIHQSSIGQSYLNYVPAPRFVNQFGLQHNEHGYRGPAVPFSKPPETLRILCLGGSTTYGWKVPVPHETYPARLEELLQRSPPAGKARVEVINAGLPWGTTAELLTHYLFKWHYYEPDLVIINTGGNDTMPFWHPHYQPDYGHWRRQMPALPRVSAAGRWLMHSRFASLLLIPLLHGTQPAQVRFVEPAWKPAPAPWFPPHEVDALGIAQLDEAHVAFNHNLAALLDAIRNDGHRVLLVPFRRAPDEDIYPEVMHELIDRNEARLLRIAERRSLPVAPFPAETVSDDNWVDECHVNSAGALQKARHVAEHVRRLYAQTPDVPPDPAPPPAPDADAGAAVPGPE